MHRPAAISPAAAIHRASLDRTLMIPTPTDTVIGATIRIRSAIATTATRVSERGGAAAVSSSASRSLRIAHTVTAATDPPSSRTTTTGAMIHTGAAGRAAGILAGTSRARSAICRATTTPLRCTTRRTTITSPRTVSHTLHPAAIQHRQRPRMLPPLPMMAGTCSLRVIIVKPAAHLIGR